MQIKEIILFGKNKQIRKLKFNLNSLNIISGSSKTGKSALLDIIDYCLGSGECHVSDGIIRETVDWYSLILRLNNYDFFVARKAPDNGAKSSSKCFYKKDSCIIFENFFEILPNINIDELIKELNKECGITFVNVPLSYQSRSNLSVTIRHALSYCFQDQNEIASKHVLLHKQNEAFAEMALKDSFMFLFGCSNFDSLSLVSERRILVSKLRLIEKNIDSINLFLTAKDKKGLEIIGLARDDGFLKFNDDEISSKLIEEKINEFTQMNYESISSDGLKTDPEIAKYNIIIFDEENSISELENKIFSIEEFEKLEDKFSKVLTEEKETLNCVGIYEHLINEPSFLNSNNFGKDTIEKIKKTIAELAERINKINLKKQNYSEIKSRYIDEKQKISVELEKHKILLKSLNEKEKNKSHLRDKQIRFAELKGMAKSWLDSIKTVNVEDYQTQKEDCEKRINEIDLILSKEKDQDKLNFALSSIQTYMNNLSKSCDLEFLNGVYRFDYNRFLPCVDYSNHSIFLNDMGSGANWVGIHLITLLSMHNYFINNDCTVPRFLFLDQPSQVYYPNSKNSIDNEQVKNIYKLLNNFIQETGSNFQIIVVDHAYFDDLDFFKKAVIEDWDDEHKLIPKSWIN